MSNLNRFPRRTFLRATVATAAASAIGPDVARPQSDPPPSEPVVIASGNGLAAVTRAAEMIRQRADTLDAVVAGVGLVEADSSDHSVGLGGLPNEDGIVELDASVMHGPTHRAGSVAALRRIVHASRVAQLVMERTDHVMLVGEGALRFARAHGLKDTELLTDAARRRWIRWKENHSAKDDWIAPNEDGTPSGASRMRGREDAYGTINCCALDRRGNLSGVTTTSGLAFKIPGRVGDSPIIGAGLYVDNEVGAAGAAGRGEAVILSAGSHTVVELMRSRRTPTEACLEVLKRISDRTRVRRLLDEEGRPDFQVVFYAVARDGRYGAASMWSGDPRKMFAIHSGGRGRLEETAFLHAS